MSDASENLSESGRAIGEVLAGKYRIERVVGEGGMGAVYEGKHADIGKRVAVKLVHAVHMRHPEIEERFKREARSTSVIESEHIVHIFDVGHDEKLGLFMVMEFLRGEDLAMVLAREGRVDPFAACAMTAQAAYGLEKAHEAGIIHRDLKPANVFLCSRDDGSVLVKLVDFGIAKFVREANQAESGKGLTRMGMAIGTPQYMSPEQAQGLPDLDHRTDVYSLGGVLFEALTGVPAVKSYDSYEMTIVEVITKRAPRVSEHFPGVDPALDQLVADMMEPEVNDRIANMGAVRARILEIYPEVADIRLPVAALSGDLSRLSTFSLTGRGSASAPSLGSASRIRVAIPSGEIRAPRPTNNAVTMSEGALISDEARADSETFAPRKNRSVLYALGALGLIGVGAAVALAIARMDPGEKVPATVTSGLPMTSASAAPVTTSSAATLASATTSATPATSSSAKVKPGAKNGKAGVGAPGTAATPAEPVTARPGAVNVSSEF